MEKSAEILEELKGSTKRKNVDDPVQKSLLDLRSQLYEAQTKIKDLKERLSEAEEAAKDKSEELSDTISKMRKFESKEYGLKEAIDEVQTMKKSLTSRDKQIQELTNQANLLQYENSELKEENFDMREKLGMEPRPQGESESLNEKDLEIKSKPHDRALMQVN